MKGLLLASALITAAASAQQLATSTPQPAGSPLGTNTGDYNVTNSWELGYRFHTVNGNSGKYRSDVNYGNGIRLLGGSLGVHSRDGKGSLFDEILLNVGGLGNDPYQFSTFRVQKNAIYRYDLLWRSSEYFNPALTITGGNHLLSTNRQMQDHDLTILPQSRLRFRFGYSGNSQTGAGLSTGQWFDSRGDEYAFLSNVRRVQREYRIGADLELRRLKLSVTRGWETFKDDTAYGTPVSAAGANVTDANTLSLVRRDEPVHGQTPYWRAHLHSELLQSFTINAKFTHSDGQRDFLFDEFVRGTDRLGSDRNRQILLAGRGRRPVTTGYLTLTWHPNSQWTFTNQTGFHNTRMDGSGRYSELNNGTAGLTLISFQNLGIRNISNFSEGSWQPVKWIGFFGNYQFSERRIRSIELTDLALPANTRPDEQVNRQKAGTGGIRLQPFKPLRMSFSAEVGRNDKPFYPVSDKDYHALNARLQYRTAKYNLSTDYRSFNNSNTTSLFVYSTAGRSWSANGGWMPRAGVQLDAGYSYIHLDTLTGLAYFASFERIDKDRSYYLSNLHTVHAGVQLQIRKRVDLYAGYVRTQDRADGRKAADQSSMPQALVTPSTLSAFAAAQVFPVAYQSPLARISVVLRRNLRWNAGWQYYDYGEKLLRLQDYSAHTGYVSLSYSF
ncbi:MAG: hypothetical protein HYX27_07245 [Acidobacteria bacterium]|nr:hypothetical protein [Acidobacteriota bacterium]